MKTSPKSDKAAAAGAGARLDKGPGAPASVVVDRTLCVVEANDGGARYLQRADGELRIPAKFAKGASQLLRRAAAGGESICSRPLNIVADGVSGPTRLIVDTLPHQLFLIRFEPCPQASKTASGRIRELEQRVRELLEAQEAAAGKEQAATEEARISEEELRTTNEELLTAKYELETANEMLTTYNEELRARNAELNQLNDDLLNLIASARLPILMLGEDLRIRRFTPDAQKILNLLPSDIGRPVRDFRLKIDIRDLETLARGVLRDLKPRKRLVRDGEGKAHSMWIRPYRTSSNLIEGVVISLVDDAGASSGDDDRYRRMFEAARDAVLLLDAETGEVLDANESVTRLCGFPRGEWIGWPLSEAPAFRGSRAAVALMADLRSNHLLDRTITVVNARGQRLSAELSAVTYRDNGRLITQLALRPGRPPAAGLQPEWDVNGIAAGLDRLSSPRIDIRIEPAAGAGRFRGDRAQVAELARSLVSEACGALPEGGRIRIVTADLDVTQEAAGSHPGIPPGSYVTLEVRACSERTANRPVPGAAITRLAEDCLVRTRQIEGGFAHTIYLPRVPDKVPAAARTILVVDDESALRQMLARMLRQMGYTVLEASQGAEAIRVARAHKGPLDLLLTDVIMPFMSGRELADRLQPARPEMQVIYMTAHEEEMVEPHGLLEEGTILLQKPFTREALARTVRELLGNGETGKEETGA